jgi:hypothetical protein
MDKRYKILLVGPVKESFPRVLGSHKSLRPTALPRRLTNEMLLRGKIDLDFY